jgi:hypothetical protein
MPEKQFDRGKHSSQYGAKFSSRTFLFSLLAQKYFMEQS